jgi:flagellar basal-body rod protein FlgB
MPRTPSIDQLATTAAAAYEQRQKAIANNLANLRKPGYLRQDVKFEDALQSELERPGRRFNLAEIQTELYQPRNTPLGVDGNDVDLDTEVTNMMSNAGRYKTMMRLLKKTYMQYEMAMKTQG